MLKSNQLFSSSFNLTLAKLDFRQDRIVLLLLIGPVFTRANFKLIESLGSLTTELANTLRQTPIMILTASLDTRIELTTISLVLTQTYSDTTQATSDSVTLDRSVLDF